MDFGDIARQGEEMAKANQQSQAAAVRELAQRLGTTPELAEYLLRLESRIKELESGT